MLWYAYKTGEVTLASGKTSDFYINYAYQNDCFLLAIGVRKQPKGHGTGTYLEGLSAILIKAQVLLIENVLTTGDSTV